MRHRGRNIFIPARKALEIVAHELGGRADREVGLLLFFSERLFTAALVAAEMMTALTMMPTSISSSAISMDAPF